MLCTESAEGMDRLLEVVADFCRWSGMRVKLEKSVATAFDFLQKQELFTVGILYQGVPLVHLPASESFSYLGVRASILARISRRDQCRKWRTGSSPNLETEKTHIFSVTKELVGIAKQHRYLLGQMVPVMQMVASARFRYSAVLVPWTQRQITTKRSLHALASRANSTPSDNYTMPSYHKRGKILSIP